MRFNKKGFVVISSMNKDQEIAFILFLLTERQRHLDDVKVCDERIEKAAKRHGLTVTPQGEVGEEE